MCAARPRIQPRARRRRQLPCWFQYLPVTRPSGALAPTLSRRCNHPWPLDLREAFVTPLSSERANANVALPRCKGSETTWILPFQFARSAHMTSTVRLPEDAVPQATHPWTCRRCRMLSAQCCPRPTPNVRPKSAIRCTPSHSSAITDTSCSLFGSTARSHVEPSRPR